MPSIDKQAVEAGEEADMAAEYEETGDDGVIENETPERLLRSTRNRTKPKAYSPSMSAMTLNYEMSATKY